MKHEPYELLIDSSLDRELNEAEQAELQEALRESPAARQRYWESLIQDGLLRELLRETRGKDLALVERSAHQESDTDLFAKPTATARLSKALKHSLVYAVVAASVLIAILVWSNSTTTLAAPLGKLQSLSGQVSVRDANGKLTPAVSGSIVRYGQAILVESPDSSAELQLDDGSTLLVEADSVLVLPANPAAVTQYMEHTRSGFYLERGGLSVQANLPSSQKPLLLATAQALVKVFGTELRLYTDARESRLELNEGSVQLYRQADQQEIVVSAGEYATIPATLVSQDLQPLEAKSLSLAKCELRHTLLRAGRAARLSWDTQTLATVRGRELRLWDTLTGELKKKLTNLENTPEQLAFRSDDESIVAITQRGQVLTWPLHQDQPILYQLPEDSVRMAYLAVDGSTVAQALTSKSARLQLWSLTGSSQAQARPQSFAGKPWSVAVTAAGSAQTAAAALWNGEIHLYAAQNGEQLEFWRSGTAARPIEISRQSRFVAAYSHEAGLMLYKRKPTAATESTEGQSLWSHLGTRVHSLKFSRDEKLLLAAFDDGLVRAWSTHTGEMLLVLQTGDPRVIDLDLSGDSKILITVGHNDSVKVWQCAWPELLEGI